jgi:hypothetical protein
LPLQLRFRFRNGGIEDLKFSVRAASAVPFEVVGAGAVVQAVADIVRFLDAERMVAI